MMPVNKIYIWSGYLSVLLGALAAAGMARAAWLYYAMGLSLLGMVLAITNIFLNVRYFSEQESTPKGYFGLFLSSLPVIFLMLIIFKFRR